MYRRGKQARLLTGGLIGALPVTTPGDEHWDDVTLLLDGSGTTDLSTASSTVTPSGSGYTTGNTSGAKFGQYIDFQNSGYFNVALPSALGVSNEPFTVETWVYVDAGTNDGVFQLYEPGDTLNSTPVDGTQSLAVARKNGTWTVYNGTGTVNSIGTSALQTWYHVALVYDGTDLVFYVNGSVEHTESSWTPNGTGYPNIGIGGYYDTTVVLDGYIEDFRVTKGVARYTAAFTPPTASFLTNAPVVGRRGVGTYDTGDEHWNDVSLLIRGDTLTDLSANGHTLTAINGASAGGADTKHASGSLSFDGVNDGIDVTASDLPVPADGGFTIEAWAKWGTATPSTSMTVAAYGDPTATKACGLRSNSTNGYASYFWSADLTTGDITTGANAVTLTDWHHVAVTFDGTTRTIWVNGVSRASDTPTWTLTTNDNLSIGYRNADLLGPTHSWNGNIEDFRITKGVARYTAAFTPPTRSLPTVLAGTPEATATLRTRGYIGAAPAPLSVDTFATLDPSFRGGLTGEQVTENNLKYYCPPGSENYVAATMSKTTGKWYFECLYDGSTNNSGHGIVGWTYDDISQATTTSTNPMDDDYGGMFLFNRDASSSDNGKVVIDAAATAIIATPTTAPNDVVGVAFDADTQKIWFSVNGVWLDNVDPVNGSLPSQYGTMTSGKTYIPFIGHFSASTASNRKTQAILNFGQDATFVGQKSPSTTYTDANGLGEFQYEPPAGFVGLYTTNTQVNSPRAGGMLTLYDRLLSIKASGGLTADIMDGGQHYRVHTFNSSGTFTAHAPLTDVEYLVIGGGGAGGYGGGGGGGAGGYRCSVSGESSGGGASAEATLNLPVGDHTITVGAGGTYVSGGGGFSGSSSSIGAYVTASGGGYGSEPGLNGATGGSGGGGRFNQTGGSGTANEGYAGGGTAGNYTASGGGGAGGAGSTGTTSASGDGGPGITSSITGTAVARGGGGGGGADYSRSDPPGSGGSGGGGDGVNEGNAATANHGEANTGGGGGGGSNRPDQFATQMAGNGGSGVVIIRYKI